EHEDRLRQALHRADAAEVALELLELALLQQRLLLGHGGELAAVPLALQLEHLADAPADRLEVGEHAAEPPLVDVRHAALGGVVLDRLLGLLLRADEQDRAAVGDDVPHEGVRGLDALQRLLEVDDVDAAALAEDEPLHLRVPAAGLVPEVDTGLQQLLHGDDSHVRSSPIGCPRRPGARRRPWGGPAAGSVEPGGRWGGRPGWGGGRGGGCPTGGTASRGARGRRTSPGPPGTGRAGWCARWPGPPAHGAASDSAPSWSVT